MAEQLALAERDAPAVQITPAAMLQLAASQQVDPDKLQKLMDFAERYQANQAKAAFNQAMSKFKAAPPRINKNKHVRFETQKGVTEYDHATLDNVTDIITKALSDVGVSHKWGVEQKGAEISVSCILTHSLGHSESTTLTATSDQSGGKNAIQAIGSTVSYLQRYTLLAATGMAVAGMDDDGKAAGTAPGMPEPEYVAWLEDIKGANSATELKAIFANAYRAAERIGDKEAMANFIKTKDEKKRGLA